MQTMDFKFCNQSWFASVRLSVWRKAISHLTPKYGIEAVVLMGTGYINSTDIPETQLKGHLKLAQKSLSSLACRLDPESALQLDFWAGG